MNHTESSIEGRDLEIRKKIEAVRRLNIGPEQKAGIILTILGLKPAAELDLYKNNDDQETVEAALAESGLNFSRKEILNPEKSPNLTAIFVIAQNDETMGKLLSSEANRDHVAYGELMGYPKSAVAAFDNRQDLLPENQYPDMAGIIFRFKLSKTGWPEELKVLREWSEAIREKAPDLYKQLNR